MTVLSSKKIFQERGTDDSDIITALNLTHKALSDVSCLSEFRNLGRLDLSFNNLSSLEGVNSCVNLKWLSVQQNKLQSLRGIEELNKLTVLNAGKNKIRSIDEVNSLVNLRALILNDNEIASLCKLDQMKELNTLVLSRNPIREIGESLFKVKSITKLSLSNCQLEKIGSSLKSCTELKELRLAHNDIKSLPAELAHNNKIQNLDVGNNLITSLSDLKVLSSLINLTNLNIRGNPIAEKEKLEKKIKRLMPNLKIFNARPMDKTMKTVKDGRDDDSALNVDNRPMKQEGEQIDRSKGEKNSKYIVLQESKDDHLDGARNLDMEKELKPKKQKTGIPMENSSEHSANPAALEEDFKKKLKRVQENKRYAADDEENPYPVELKCKKRKTKEYAMKKPSGRERDSAIKGKKSKKPKQDDDGETQLVDLFTAGVAEKSVDIAEEMDHKTSQQVDMIAGALVTFPKKTKIIKSHGMGPALQLLSPAAEVGLGGPSTWDDE